MHYSSTLGFAKPFRIYLRTTLGLKLLVWIPHLLALFLVVAFWITSTPKSLTPWVLTVSLASILGIVFSFIYYSRLHIWKTLDQSIYEISQDSAKNWMVVCWNKDSHQVELLPSSFVSTLLVILNFKGNDNQNFTAVIVPNTLPDQHFRQLRVRMKIS